MIPAGPRRSSLEPNDGPLATAIRWVARPVRRTTDTVSEPSPVSRANPSPASLSRRALLSALPLPWLAGCGSRSNAEEGDLTATASSTRRPDPSEPATASASSGTKRTTVGHRAAVGSVTVANDAAEDRFVTVVVEAEHGTEPLLVESRTIRSGTAITFDGVVPSTGSYRVVVDTAAGPNDTFDWQVTPVLDALRVRIDDEVRFSRPVLCDPDCPGVDLGGTATGYPEGGFDPRGRRAGSELRVRNVGGGARTIRVRVADGDILDYRYWVPPSTMLVIPVPQRSGETAVGIDLGSGRTREFDWAMEADPVRDVRV